MNEEEVLKAFIDNRCHIAECTGLTYEPFKRIVEFGYNLALKEMPKWRKAKGGYGQMRYRVYLTEKGVYLYDQIEHREINIDELDKLPMKD